ncbi:amidohydrolase [Mongoliitalea daihaiensis]|uniref:amidohydrolase n=1 Tax=Mongoliitalea daihaiensis TaxID=2782006 RepID=UPI001F29BA36|nr:amidohydrolase [Mongoliitalea daihaiensis]UJP66018.1 amidohydrolase [Mongoliitalea daihaiensis]
MNTPTIQSLIQLRRYLHQYPEISGNESKTAQKIHELFQELEIDRYYTALGKTGLAYVFEGPQLGPTSLFRCELDGLPIQENNPNISHSSKISGTSHVCGHDGHMAIITGLGMHLSANKPSKGRVVLLFQPAEETGEGAEAVIADPRFAEVYPDYAFALHNLPGYELHQIVLKEGAFAAASVGISIHLKGWNSHSAHPEAGKSPAKAMAELVLGLEKLPASIEDFSLVTVIHAKLGEVAFGTTPGEAVVMATLRGFTNEVRDLLVEQARRLAEELAAQSGLGLEITLTESFAATHNDPEATAIGIKAAHELALDILEAKQPFRWSEDFGLFSSHTKTLLFGLGSGLQQPQLHEPTFDFPDEIIETGISMFKKIIDLIHE